MQNNKTQNLNYVNATAEQAKHVMDFFNQSIKALHGKVISLDEWKEALSSRDPDEENFIICNKNAAVAWFRINGLQNKDMAWLSMLVVGKDYHRQGVGQFAVETAENLVMEKGFSKLYIHTTEDNLPAQSLYIKCGYKVTEHGKCTTGDGKERMGLTFEKDLV